MSSDDDAFYMAIQNPKEFRRDLLGSSKDVIHLIQRYERIKELREEKIKRMYDFADKLQEINMILGKLKKVIPATKLRKLGDKLDEQRKQAPKRVKTSSNQVNTLQKELEMIEKKLENLS